MASRSERALSSQVGRVTRESGAHVGRAFSGPALGWLGLFIPSLSPHGLRGGEETEAGREALGWAASEPRGLRRLLQTLPTGCPHLCPLTPGVPNPLCVHLPLPFAPWPWQPAWVAMGRGGVSPWQRGVAGRRGRGEGVPLPAGSGGRGARSHEIPSQGMWSGRPALCEPSRSREPLFKAGTADTQQTGCSAPAWPPTLPPLKGWHRAAGRPVVATPCSAPELEPPELKAALVLKANEVAGLLAK